VQENLKSEGFTCVLCDYSSKNPKLLIGHVKNIHRKTKKASKFNCTYCSEQFKSLQHLKIHVFREHKAAYKRQEKCLCTLCGKTLIGKSNGKFFITSTEFDKNISD
jgi:hypothetical protein